MPSRQRVLLFVAITCLQGCAFGSRSGAQILVPKREPADVRIGVLSLFHPQRLVVTSPRSATMLLDDQAHTLPALQEVIVYATDEGISVRFSRSGPETMPAKEITFLTSSVTLTVPEKLTRTYTGELTISVARRNLVAVVAMPTEIAVASIVAAEAPPHAGLEALKAQAIASRSYLLGNASAHHDYDACDTTHCQYLRAPPLAGSPAALATLATAGVVLTWRADAGSANTIVRAMYSRSCGGQTRVPPSVAAGTYPYYSVGCEFCRRHPERWIRANTAAPETEQQRIAYNRLNGWSAVPSNRHAVVASTLEGRGVGHGVGLCQAGAADMAARGASASEILRHYFPNATLASIGR